MPRWSNRWHSEIFATWSWYSDTQKSWTIAPLSTNSQRFSFTMPRVLVAAAKPGTISCLKDAQSTDTCQYSVNLRSGKDIEWRCIYEVACNVFHCKQRLSLDIFSALNIQVLHRFGFVVVLPKFSFSLAKWSITKTLSQAGSSKPWSGNNIAASSGGLSKCGCGKSTTCLQHNLQCIMHFCSFSTTFHNNISEPMVQRQFKAATSCSFATRISLMQGPIPATYNFWMDSLAWNFCCLNPCGTQLGERIDVVFHLRGYLILLCAGNLFCQSILFRAAEFGPQPATG